VVGLDGNGELKSRITSIADIDPLQLPLSRSVQFRESNLEVASLLNAPDDFVGVLADDLGRVRGLWASFASDNGRELIQRIAVCRATWWPRRSISCARAGRCIRWRRNSPAVAGERAPTEIERRLGAAHRKGQPAAREVLSVARLVAGSDAARMLQPATYCWRSTTSR